MLFTLPPIMGRVRLWVLGLLLLCSPSLALTQVDLAVQSLQGPVAPFAPGAHDVTIVLHNLGPDTLTSASLSWEVNAVAQPAYAWTGSLPSGGSDTLTIGSYVFSSLSLDSVLCWSGVPNGGADSDPSNDTLGVLLTPALQGTYSIGGASPDFLNFTAATNFLNAGGVTGAVTFNARSGSYHEQIALIGVPGNHVSNPIIFQSESGDSTDVVIHYSATTSLDNYVVRTIETDAVTFQHLTLQADGPDYGTVVEVVGAATQSALLNNQIIGIDTANSNRKYAVVDLGGGSQIDSFTIAHNRIEYGSYGIYFFGGWNPITFDSEPSLRTTIRENSLLNQHETGIYLDEHIGPIVLGNYILADSENAFFYGIYLTNSEEDLQVTKNTLRLPSGGTGVFLDYCMSTAAKKGLIANNMIAVGGSNFSNGIYLGFSDHQRIAFNSVDISTNDNSSAAFRAEYSNSLDNLNNIFVASGSGLAIWGDDHLAFSTSDYNDLYTTGSNLVEMGGSTLTDLSDWQSSFYFDQNSLSLDPLFAATDDLHIGEAILFGAGTPLSYITDDIDGESRDAHLPSMGADEQPTPSLDAGLPSFEPAAIPISEGLSPLKVVLKNYGSDTLTFAMLGWEVNGSSQPSLAWTGSLASGDTAQVTLGNFSFTLGVSYSLTAWCASPNMMMDTIPQNDTLSAIGVFTGLAGVYTVGGASPDFATLTDAVQALEQGGANDSVTFMIRSGTYIEQLSINQLPGPECSVPIVFRAESGDSSDVTITFDATVSTSNYIVQLDGADGITFQYLTFQAVNTTNGRIIDIREGAHCNQFLNCHFTGISGFSTSTARALIFSGDDLDNDNVFQNNYFLNGSMAIYLVGQSSSLEETGTVITGNTIEGAIRYGIWLDEQLSPVISGNTIMATSAASSGFSAIFLDQCDEQIIVSHNLIQLDDDGYGINLNFCDAADTARGRIFNNMISVGGNGNSYGIYNRYGIQLEFTHNSVHVHGTSTISRAYYGFSGGDNYLYNNIFSNTGGGQAIYVSTASHLAASDYNDLFATGTYLAFLDFDRTDLSEWQIASGMDSQSISEDPTFQAIDDLHVSLITLNGTATPISYVTDDIDGEPRSLSAPDIGADEFTPTNLYDAGITAITGPSAPFAAGSHQVITHLKNYGADTLTQVNVHWVINGAIQSVFAWTGTLAPGREDTVALGAFSFTDATAFDIAAWTSSPNAQLDTVSSNDTATVIDLYPALLGTYTVGGISPDFTDLSTPITILNHGGVLGPVELVLRSGTFTEQNVLGTIPGVSVTDSVLIRGESGDSSTVILTATGTNSHNYVLKLEGTSYVTFRHLTFKNVTNIYGRGIHLEGRSHHICFENNYFLGNTNNVSSTNRAIVYSSNDQDEYITFRQNRFEQGTYGIYMLGTSSLHEAGNVVASNIFRDQYARAIHLDEQDAPIIHDNDIVGRAGGTLFRGIYCEESDGAMRIEGNRIITADGAYGIYLDDCDGQMGMEGLIANNMITVGGTGTSNGLYIYSCARQKIYHNNVLVTNTDPFNGRTAYFRFGSEIDLKNNVFANTGGGYSLYIGSFLSSLTSDYNNLYTTGANLGYWQPDTLPSLSAWWSTGQDSNSISVDPLFFANEDLHVKQVALDSAATPVAEVSVDYDDEMRNLSTPDIGADESDFLDNDLGVIDILVAGTGCDTGQVGTVTIVIQNYGVQTQSGFDASFIFAGDTTTENVGGLSVLAGDTASFTFTDTVLLPSPGIYVFDAYTNLLGDLDMGNDTLAGDSLEKYTLQAVDSVSNMLPLDSTLGMDLPINFSWAPAANATQYDMFIWENGDTKPTDPTEADITQISFLYTGNLTYGTEYLWQIRAENECFDQDGPIQLFEVRDLPDLIVNNVQAPASAFSSTSISVSWEVENIGAGSTLSESWQDYVYLSFDQILDRNVDLYLGGVSNLTSLNAGGNYAQSMNLTLPNGLSGSYYLIVAANGDFWGAMQEADNDNNEGVSVIPILISLRPPPDLQITSLTGPNNAFSGQTITVDWTVENKGSGATLEGSWRDRLYLSPDPLFIQANATLLATETRMGNLDPDSSYATSIAVNLPNGIFGTYHLYLFTDYYNDVYEHASESNNDARSDTMNIVLTPPPDLLVSTITAPDSASGGEKVSLSWTVENQGGSTTISPYWDDRVYLTTSPTYDLSQAITLDTYRRTTPLANGASYTKTKTVTIPTGINGPYYFYVTTDVNDQEDEFGQETNNTLIAPHLTEILHPDLVVSSFSTPASDTAGHDISVSWTVKNVGFGSMPVQSWWNRISISTHGTYDPDSLTELKRIRMTESFQSGDSVNSLTTITLPHGLSGTYYLYLETDIDGEIYEAGDTTQNFAKTSISIYLPPWPDLIADTVTQGPDSLIAGSNIGIGFTLSNQGLSTAPDGWVNNIYVSPEPVWNPSNAYLLGQYTVHASLTPGDSLMHEDSLVMPMLSIMTPGLDSFTYVYVYVEVDQRDDVYEHTDEGNNIQRSDSFFVRCPGPPDLEVTTFTGPDTATSGLDITVDWAVINNSNPTDFWNYYYWYDGIYLSTDSIWDPSDVFVTDWTLYGPLGLGEYYAETQTLTLPDGISGDYYLLMVADHTSLIKDLNPANNALAMRDGMNQAQQIHIQLREPTDLLPISFISPTTGTSGQPISPVWQVKNNGTGTTIAGGWEDHIYLSTDGVIDSLDVLLGSKSHTGDLLPGETYLDTLEVFLPISATGNYLLLFKTDFPNEEYEHLAEGNNEASALITISQPPPADLIVNGFTLPDSAMAGDSVSLSWTVENEGSYAANGKMKELIYLSADSLWDVGDVLVGENWPTVNLAPGASTMHTYHGPLPGVDLDDYHVIVLTDALNNIYESVDTNNTGISSALVTVTLRTLPLEVWTPDTMPNGQARYFQIEIPDSLNGESMLISLLGDSLQGANELYLSYEEVPTRATHDFVHEGLLAGNVDLVVPTLRTGTYYLMMYGSTSGGTSQALQVLAHIPGFELWEVNANKGGNTGKVTVELRGAKFQSTMMARLKDPVLGSMLMDTLYYENPSTVFVTFDLNGASLGHYDVILERTDGDSTGISDGFEVEAGTGEILMTSINYPAGVRPNRTLAMTIAFANGGNVDIPAPSRTLLAIDRAPVAKRLSDLRYEDPSLRLRFGEVNGPSDVLRPGVNSSITIYTKSTRRLRFKLIE